MTTPVQVRPDSRIEGYRLKAEAHRLRAQAEELDAQAAELFAQVEPADLGGAGDDLLSYDEAGQDLGMSADYVRGLCRAGRLPVVRLGARRRIRRSDLEELKERRVFRPAG